jgi:hypothetical protein
MAILRGLLFYWSAMTWFLGMDTERDLKGLRCRRSSFGAIEVGILWR